MFITTKKHNEIIKKLKNDLENKYDDSISTLEKLVDKLEQRIQNNDEAISLFSKDLLEAKNEIDFWRDKDGLITNFNGMQLVQEVVDKLLIRLDFYYLNDKQKYPDDGLHLINTKDNFYENAKTKSDKFINEIINRTNKN
jgi:hypothetical protein